MSGRNGGLNNGGDFARKSHRILVLEILAQGHAYSSLKVLAAWDRLASRRFFGLEHTNGRGRRDASAPRAKHVDFARSLTFTSLWEDAGPLHVWFARGW